MNKVIVIPARFKSYRFPGKPLVQILGKSLLYRTWSIAKSIKNIDEVFVATDDARIKEHAISFGAKVVMTSESCINGTVRVFEALNVLNLKPNIIINVQGDAPLILPKIIQKLLDNMINKEEIKFGTLAARITKAQYELMLKAQYSGTPGGTTVVFDNDNNALYFSKSLIPSIKQLPESSSEYVPVYRHIGVYAYRYNTLERYLNLPPSRLEELEGLEQLRALENGIPIRIIPVETEGRTDWDVNNPEDIAIVERILHEEGELSTIA